MVRGIPDKSMESWLTFFCRLVFRLMVERGRDREIIKENTLIHLSPKGESTWDRGELTKNMG